MRLRRWVVAVGPSSSSWGSPPPLAPTARSTARFSTYATGDIAIVANTVEAVTASASSVSAGPLAGIAC